MYRVDDNERGAEIDFRAASSGSQALLRRVVTYKIDLILLLAAAASLITSCVIITPKKPLQLALVRRIPLCHRGRNSLRPERSLVVNVTCVYVSRAVAVHLRDNSAIAPYCNGFAGVPGLTPECFFACAINSRTLSLPS